jgi:hypothetical protein
MLSVKQFWDLMECRTIHVWTAAHNLANGHALTPGDPKDLDKAADEILTLIDEARA